jgi:hypothetical protein
MLSSEAYQFDWSRDIVVMDRVMPTVKVAHVRLYRSRDARFVELRSPYELDPIRGTTRG